MIEVVRGDTITLPIYIYDTLNILYTPCDTDQITFCMKKYYNQTDPTYQAEIDPHEMILRIPSSETEQFKAGSYVYDVKLKFKSGEVTTIISSAILKVKEEVG